MSETQKYELVKKLVETKGNKERVACKLGKSERTVNRLIKGYKEEGKAFFEHGNRGRKPAITLSEETKSTVIDLYNNKYDDCNFEHFKELLEANEHITMSVSAIRNWLKSEHILSPKAHRRTKKEESKRLKALKSTAKNKKEVTTIESSIIALEDAHPRRPRSKYFGELIQMDASLHPWFGGLKTQLHVAIDDCKGHIVGAYFDKQETLKGYYNVLYQILTNYGIPCDFFTDKRTVFEYNKRGENNVEKDTFTQFSYACKQLGVGIKTSSVPQAKGRVERLFNTLQSRLSAELRLSGITTIEEANSFLLTYIKKFNERFALPLNDTKSVFVKQDLSKINYLLAVISVRKIDSGCCIKYHNNYYLPVNSDGVAVHHRKGTAVLVIKAFDNALYCTIGETLYALELVPSHKASSKNFDLVQLETKPKKKYIPPMSHPWKRPSFERYLRGQVRSLAEYEAL